MVRISNRTIIDWSPEDTYDNLYIKDLETGTINYQFNPTDIADGKNHEIVINNCFFVSFETDGHVPTKNGKKSTEWNEWGFMVSVSPIQDVDMPTVQPTVQPNFSNNKNDDADCDDDDADCVKNSANSVIRSKWIVLGSTLLATGIAIFLSSI